MSVIIYARYSGSAQSQGTSVERQVELAEAYAKTHGLIVTEPPLIDRGKSAFHALHKRGKMGQLLARVASGDLGHGDIILVEMIDRMSREKVMIAFDQLRTFTNAGVTIITTFDGTVLNAETFDQQWSRIIEPLAKMAGAHDESAKKSSRTTDNWQRKRASGVNMVTALPGWLEKKTGKPIKERVQTVHQIYDLYLSGYGAGVIAKKLNAVPVPAWGNGRKDTYSVWSSATVAKVLNNRAVMGEYQPRSKGEIVGPAVADYFPQIIEPETFFKAQALMKTRVFGGEGSGRKAEGSANIFRGLALCGSCRRRMNMTAGGGVRSLRCYGSRVGSCENTRGFRYEKLEEAVLKTVSEIQLSDQSGSARLRGVQSEIASVTHAIETVKGNVAFLVEQSMTERSPAFAKKAMEEEAKLEALEQNLESLKGDLASLSSPLTHHQNDLVSAFDQLAKAKDQEEVRQRLNMTLTALVDKIVFSANHNVMIHFKDATTYVLRYRLKANLPKQKRVGSRPITDFEWYAGRVGGQDMMDAWAASLEELDQEAA
ncbi:MAG: recombinase family protein [Brevundimonas mediterranea]|uniref:recombinase family protein n=1 Tax=Brevundimonas mediterranea TaxID=74329 RepID=UPI0040333398